MEFTRAGGILLHPTSLPGPYGIGDLGKCAQNFVEFLHNAKLGLWQVLPVNPTGYGNSPYQTLSAFAGNPLLISLDDLVSHGLLTKDDLHTTLEFSTDRIKYQDVMPFHAEKLHRAHENFRNGQAQHLKEAFERFCHENAFWLEDYALFIALKEAHDLQLWTYWSPELVKRDPLAISDWREKLATRINAARFNQFLFFQQWHALKAYANERNIKLIGDIPIFLAHDSADVWSNPHLFHLDEGGWPTVVAGVPPDYFSETGQLWGNPLYRWEILAEQNYEWWVKRFRTAFETVDIIRIDHFRGFESYWEVPAAADTAIHGRWVKGPGSGFFRSLEQQLGRLPILAEDLGVITDEVKALRDEFGFPGFRILQFAFDNNDDARSFLPHNHPRNCVVYTGTHDNDTSIGWYKNENGGYSTRSVEEVATARKQACEYFNSDGTQINWDFIRYAFASVANTALIPMQDVLGLGSKSRMNYPGRPNENWEWRYKEDDITPELSEKLRQLSKIYERDGIAELKF
ncbi:MAG: 4-alpha-glucanotransferase [Deferribacteres bacterium]|nr:4-alpha-glucanotransferase [candidate division KSB1 bacterium]MCB9502358.1 4-alpha-glucanotransferase [Deferribacteres bacterium]